MYFSWVFSFIYSLLLQVKGFNSYSTSLFPFPSFLLSFFPLAAEGMEISEIESFESTKGEGSVEECVCACMCMCVCVCVRVCARVCGGWWKRGSVWAWRGEERLACVEESLTYQGEEGKAMGKRFTKRRVCAALGRRVSWGSVSVGWRSAG